MFEGRFNDWMCKKAHQLNHWTKALKELVIFY